MMPRHHCTWLVSALWQLISHVAGFSFFIWIYFLMDTYLTSNVLKTIFIFLLSFPSTCSSVSLVFFCTLCVCSDINVSSCILLLHWLRYDVLMSWLSLMISHTQCWKNCYTWIAAECWKKESEIVFVDDADFLIKVLTWKCVSCISLGMSCGEIFNMQPPKGYFFDV